MRTRGKDALDRANEAAYVNEAARELCERFKIDGRPVDSVVTVVLFRTSPPQRDFHIAQMTDTDTPDEKKKQEEADELLCESTVRLEEHAKRVASRHMEEGGSAEETEPACSDAGGGDGLGCPKCHRFEVRVHKGRCDDHGQVQLLSCCRCGLVILEAKEFWPGDGRLPPQVQMGRA